MFHSNNSIGVDLLSYDIQRGRDTGLPPYNKMRQLCGLPVAKSFGDLVDIIPIDVSENSCYNINFFLIRHWVIYCYNVMVETLLLFTRFN